MHYVPRAPGMSTFSEDQAKLLADAGYELEQRELEVRPLDEATWRGWSTRCSAASTGPGGGRG